MFQKAACLLIYGKADGVKFKSVVCAIHCTFPHEYYLEYSFMLTAITINLPWDILQIQYSVNEKVLLTFLWVFLIAEMNLTL